MATEYLNAYYLTHFKNNNPTSMNLGAILDIINNAYNYVSRRLGTNIGKIEPSFVSDFMLLPYTPFTDMNSSNAFGHIFFGLYPNFKPVDVYVNGVRLVRNGELTSKKVKEELIKSREYSNKLWKKVKELN
jgi:hypothetical protein